MQQTKREPGRVTVRGVTFSRYYKRNAAGDLVRVGSARWCDTYCALLVADGASTGRTGGRGTKWHVVGTDIRGTLGQVADQLSDRSADHAQERFERSLEVPR